MAKAKSERKIADMDLQSRLAQDLKDAMRARDTLRTETVRAIRAAVMNREVEKGDTLGDDDVIATIRSLVKQRDDAIAAFEEGGRPDAAESERKEKEILLAYLPAAPDTATIEATVDAVIAELGASSMKDMGRVMKACKEKLGAGADGKVVSATVKGKLAG